MHFLLPKRCINHGLRFFLYRATLEHIHTDAGRAAGVVVHYTGDIPKDDIEVKSHNSPLLFDLMKIDSN